MRRIYVAGPFTSDPIGNTAQAVEAARELAAAGLHPFVPHVACEWAAELDGYEGAMVECIAWVTVCDAVLRVPGASPGADREVAHARRRRMPVFYAVADVLAWATADPARPAREALREAERRFAAGTATGEEVAAARVRHRLAARAAKGEPVLVSPVAQSD